MTQSHIFIKIVGKHRFMAFPDSKNPTSSKAMVLWGTGSGYAGKKALVSVGRLSSQKVSGNCGHIRAFCTKQTSPLT